MTQDLKFTTAGEYMSDKGYELCSLEQAEEFAQFREYKTRHLETSKKIVEFIKSKQNVPNNSNCIPDKSPSSNSNAKRSGL